MCEIMDHAKQTVKDGFECITVQLAEVTKQLLALSDSTKVNPDSKKKAA